MSLGHTPHPASRISHPASRIANPRIPHPNPASQSRIPIPNPDPESQSRIPHRGSESQRAERILLSHAGMAKKLEDLPIYKHAVDFCAAVTAVLARPALRRNRQLHKQIDTANDSITANMEEGFEQSTDRLFANYLFIAKGSLAEVLGRLKTANRKGCISLEELDKHLETGENLAKMIGGFIRYLNESDFKDRGRFKKRDRIRDSG